MALLKRIIPRLDIKGPNLVKGIHLEGLRVLGKPEDFAKFYYNQGADELIYQDTVASLYQRNNLKEIISRTAENIFIPITVGGGIRNIKDIEKLKDIGIKNVIFGRAFYEENITLDELENYLKNFSIRKILKITILNKVLKLF